MQSYIKEMFQWKKIWKTQKKINKYINQAGQ